MNDLELFKELQKSPILFIEKMWGLTPERDNSNFTKGKNLTWQQHDILLAIESAIGKGKKRISVRSGHGIGKAHPLDMTLDTPDGKKKWGTLKKGDYVFGSNGKPTKIIGTIKYKDIPMYRVTFDDRSYCDVSSGHLWNVKGRQERRKKIDTWRTIETIDLFNNVQRKNGKTTAKQWEIPQITPVKYKSKNIPIHPYVLGMWLGDGGKRSTTITSNDKETGERLNELNYPFSISNKQETTAKGYRIYGLAKDLKTLDLYSKYSYEKSVPKIYLENDESIRGEVLRGLLDTDGTAGKNGSVTFCSTSKQMAEDVIWLARSLGGKAFLQPTVKHPFFKDKNGNKKMGRLAYNATLSMPEDFRCFYIKRKQNRVKKVQHRYLTRWIDKIEQLPKSDGMCIKVNSEDGLYLANDFIVTHNSTVLSWVILWYLFCHKDAQIPCTAPTSDQMHDVLWKEVAKWLQKMPPEIKEKYEWSNNYIRIVESPETWFARAKTARKESPEALAGVHGDYVLFLIDEASGVPEEIFNTAEGALTDKRAIVIMISNPTRLIGYFYDSHNSDKENWECLHFSSEDSPIVDKEYVERILDKHGKESDEYAIRVQGNFPKADAMDEAGYMPLFLKEDLRFTEADSFIGETRMGVDPAGAGKDKTVWVVRDNFKAKIVAVEKTSNSKSIAQKTLTLMQYYNVSPEYVVVDNFGVGANVAQELAMAGKQVQALNVGEKCEKEEDSELFQNIKAMGFWKAREWVRKGGELVNHSSWDELLTIRQRKELNGKMKIMGKIEMKKKGLKSPDHADAFMMTHLIEQKYQGNLKTRY